MLAKNVNIEQALQFAVAKHMEGECTTSLEIFNSVLKQDPYNGTVLNLMAMAALKNGNKQMANTLQHALGAAILF